MLCSQCGAPVDLTSARIPPTNNSPHSIRKELLTSNICPLDSETPYIDRLVEDTQPRVDALNAQIDMLQTSLTNLIRERDDLVAHAERCRAVLAPIRRVPPELVAEIFQLVPFTRRIVGKTIEQPPWTLGHICKSWRETAVGCPALWRSFTFIQSSSGAFTTLFPQAMAETQLLRAANAPLLLDFEWNQSTGTGLSVFLDTLIPHSARWKSLRIQCHNRKAAGTVLRVLQVIKGRLSQLEKAEFLAGSGSSLLDTGLESDIFSVAPRLSEILVTDLVWEGYSLKLSIPWKQIRRYRGVFESSQQLEILRKASSLVECSIGFDDLTATHGDTMVVLPSLHRLCAEGSNILDHITAPALEHLLVHKAAPSLVSFVQRSSCHLTTLAIIWSESIDGLIDVLKACPRLVHVILSITDLPSSDLGDVAPFFTALNANDLLTSTICPNLERFGFRWRSSDHAFPAEGALFGMIQSRSVKSKALRSVRLLCAGDRMPVQPGIKEGIACLEKEGVDIKYLTEAETAAYIDRLRV